MGYKEGLIMSESRYLKNKKRVCKDADQTSPSPFYGGLKSKNELYYQLASLFKEATQGRRTDQEEVISRIMMSQLSNTSGKFYPDKL